MTRSPQAQSPNAAPSPTVRLFLACGLLLWGGSGAGCMGRSSFSASPSAYETATMPSLQPGAGYGEETPGGWAEDARIVVEGHVGVTVEDTDAAVDAMRRIVGEVDGRITREKIQPGAFMSVIVVRLPPARVEDLVSLAAELGVMSERSIERSDVTWQIRDAEIRLDNLRRTLARYQALLEEATSVDEILRVEAELTRVRTELERIEGERAFLADRTALATIEVRLMKDFLRTVEPEPRMWPGLRATHLSLFTRGLRPRRYVGLGWSMHESRSFQLDIDLFTGLGPPADPVEPLQPFGTVQAAFATIGGGTYSELLSDGDRAWLNPHLGYALGYGWVEGGSNFLGLLTLGLELYRTESVLVDTGVRWGVVAGRGGPSLMLQPVASVHVAF